MYCRVPKQNSWDCRPQPNTSYCRPPLVTSIPCTETVPCRSHPPYRWGRRSRCGWTPPHARLRTAYPMRKFALVSNPANRLLHYLSEFDTVGLIYCDTKEAPVYWDFRARQYFKKQQKKNKNAAVVFVCHWSQLDQLDIILSYFSLNTFTLPVDRCCELWFDSKEVQELVSSFPGEMDVVDYPVAMRDIIRSRHIYPNLNNSCVC